MFVLSSLLVSFLLPFLTVRLRSFHSHAVRDFSLLLSSQLRDNPPDVGVHVGRGHFLDLLVVDGSGVLHRLGLERRAAVNGKDGCGRRRSRAAHVLRALRDPSRPPRDTRHTVTSLPKLALVATQNAVASLSRAAVVREEHYERVTLDPTPLQRRNDLADDVP